MKRVLFVDDEKEILDGLSNALRKHRHLWESVFAQGGRAALEEMAKGRFDVVVSDMRMPGMDGAALLKIVQERYPATARIILTGYAEEESVVRSMPVAHQFLAKPCDCNLLPKTIKRVCQLQELLHNERLKNTMGNLSNLPSPPKTYWDLTATIAQPNFDMQTVADIIGRDPSLSAKILQIINSPFFGLRKTMNDIGQAVKFLGVEMLRSLALTADIFSSVDESSLPPSFSLEAFRTSSILSAKIAAKVIADPAEADEAGIAGLLHDIGKLILAICLPEQTESLFRASITLGKTYNVMEKEPDYIPHADAGAYLLGLWNLPVSIVEAVGFHHCPSKIPVEGLHVAGAVHIADWLVDSVLPLELRTPFEVSELDAEFIARSNLREKLEDWKAMVRDEVERCGVAV